MLAFLVACSGDATKPANATNTGSSANTPVATKPTTATTTTAADASKLSDPKGSIEYQFELIKAGDYDKLKDCCFTDRVKGSLTKETVDKAKEDSSKYTMDDLFASAEDGEMDGKKTKKVKMKSGRTLTTLVETNGKWLADTIWFK